MESAFGFSRFDRAVGRNILSSYGLDLGIFARALPGAVLTLAEVMPREGGRISELFAGPLGPELAARLAAFEADFYSRTDLASLGAGREATEAALKAGGFDIDLASRRDTYPRRLSTPEVESWLSAASPYGAALAERFSPVETSRIAESISSAAAVAWPISVLYAKLRLPS